MHDLARNNAAAEAVKIAVELDPGLAFRRDGEGRTALQVAAKECKAAMQSVLFLLVLPPPPPHSLTTEPPSLTHAPKWMIIIRTD